jgi:hypothetical protein
VPFFIIIILLSFLTGWLTHYRYFSKSRVIPAGLILGFGLECPFILVMIPKLIVPVLGMGLIGTVIVWASIRYLKRLAWTGLLAVVLLIGLEALLGMQLPFDMVPAGSNAAFSLNTTSQDLGNFAEALLSAGSDSPALQEMLVEQVAIDAQSAWGLGIGIEKSPAGLTYWHSGINPGSRALIVLDPKTQTGIVVLTNGENGLELARQVAALVIGHPGKWDVR